MTDWLARAAAKLADKSRSADVPGEPKVCVKCGKPVKSPLLYVCRHGAGMQGPFCGDCEGT